LASNGENGVSAYKLTIELPALPKTTNGSHGHWSVIAAERKKWRRLVVFAVGIKRPAKPLMQAKATFTRFSSNEPDDDNLSISFKSVRDGLVDAGVIADDKNRILTATYRWEKAPPKKGKITIEVEEVT
jgi:Holliday junction resolvase RusA-like endonuclease